jgi:hypothetical protein
MHFVIQLQRSSTETMPFTITRVSGDFLAKARTAGLDDQNQPVIRLIARGGEPCRDLLRRARPGERIIAASYCPFSLPGPYREYGPVFVLQEPGNNAAGEQTLPLPTGSASDYLKADKPVVLRAYDACERIAAASLVLPERIEAELDGYFSRDDIAFVLLRFAAYGCYALRFDRG